MGISPDVIGVGHDGHDAAVWTSPDGATWAKQNHPAFGGDGAQRIRRILPVGDGFGTQFIWKVVEWNGRLFAIGGADTNIAAGR